MNNEELKKKIVDILIKTDENIRNEIIKAIEEHRAFLTEDNQYYYIVADALIAEGIGDVKEAEHRAEVAEKALDLCETAYILSLNHRATEGISGQAIASDFGIHKFFMKQAEKELMEEGK